MNHRGPSVFEGKDTDNQYPKQDSRHDRPRQQPIRMPRQCVYFRFCFVFKPNTTKRVPAPKRANTHSQRTNFRPHHVNHGLERWRILKPLPLSPLPHVCTHACTPPPLPPHTDTHIVTDLQVVDLRVGGDGELEERLLLVDPLGDALQLGQFAAQGAHVRHIHRHVVHVPQVVQLPDPVLQLLYVRDEGLGPFCQRVLKLLFALLYHLRGRRRGYRGPR